MNIATQAHIDKARREAVRWHLLTIANTYRPGGVNVVAMLPILHTAYPDATELEVRRQLDYLEGRELVKIAKDPLDNWVVDLTRAGIDVVEYTVNCEAGIARPSPVK